VAVGLGAVRVATSAPAPVDVGRPSGAARFANSQSSGRVSREKDSGHLLVRERLIL